jgi:glycosyltransferase involved in cell wall biosynthesis
MTDDGVTGIVLPATDPAPWSAAINDLLNDTPRRRRMATAAPERINRFSLAKTFDAFWQAHVDACEWAPAMNRPRLAATDGTA